MPILDYGKPEPREWKIPRVGLFPCAIGLTTFGCLVIPRMIDGHYCHPDNALFLSGCLSILNLLFSIVAMFQKRGRVYSAAGAVLSVMTILYVAMRYRSGDYRW